MHPISPPMHLARRVGELPDCVQRGTDECKGERRRASAVARGEDRGEGEYGGARGGGARTTAAARCCSAVRERGAEL